MIFKKMTTAAPFSEQTSANPYEESKAQKDTPWHVIVLNDPVNLMPYVVMVFKKIFGYDHERSTKHMREVHEEGMSILWTGAREKAELYVYALQQWQLTALLQKDA